MNKIKSLAIMPNIAGVENKPFYRTNLKNHGIGLKEFSDLYQLGIKDEDFGDEKGELFGPHWADGIAKKGQFIILFDFMIIMYVPEQLTEEQYQWIYLWKPFLKQKEENVRAIIYEKDSTEYISYGTEELTKIELIYQKIDEIYKKQNIRR